MLYISSAAPDATCARGINQCKPSPGQVCPGKAQSRLAFALLYNGGLSVQLQCT